MTDNIKPEHYRTGQEDFYESWSKTYPFNEYRAIMQAIAERYIRRNKVDRVEDLGKAIYTLERLREKEIEHREAQVLSKDETIDNAFDFIRKHENKERVSLLEHLTYSGFEYIAKDINDELWAYEDRPNKYDVQWAVSGGDTFKVRGGKTYPEVKWTDDEPTRIADLLATYENGGENGKVED